MRIARLGWIAAGMSVLLTALLMSACSQGNSVCASDCVQMNGIGSDSPDQLNARIKKMCEGMGRHGTPEIRQQDKDSVTAYCPA